MALQNYAAAAKEGSRPPNAIFASDWTDMTREDIILVAGILSVLVVVGLYLFHWNRERKGADAKSPAVADGPLPAPNRETLALQLQAYERLVLLAERISLTSLITRVPAGEMDARQYVSALVEQVRMESEHNLSQQIYVSEIAWQSVAKLREQNIFTLTRLLGILPANATGRDLAMAVAELVKADANASLHTVVLDALRKEARKLL
jgi:hypothetical protein